jgi:hypothetical protein
LVFSGVLLFAFFAKGHSVNTVTPQRTEVIATVRDPDGQPNALIDGLVVKIAAADGGWIILSKRESVAWAQKALLWCRAPNGRYPIEIEAVDLDGDGIPDYVQTRPDHTRANNLLSLDIWDRKRQIWLDSLGRRKAA